MNNTKLEEELFFKEIEDMVWKDYIYCWMRVNVNCIYKYVPMNLYYERKPWFKWVGIIELLDEQDWKTFNWENKIFANLPFIEYNN